MSSLKKEAAIQKVAQARQRVQEVLKFREEIEEEVIDLVKRQQALKNKITSRIHGKKNLNGFLVHSSDKYDSCLGVFDNNLL